MNSLSNQLEIYFREATPTLARICVRLPRGVWPLAAKLRGSISGPTSDFGATLPTVHTFVDRRQPDTLLAEAIMPEPSYWTAECPLFYELRIELLDGDKVLATHSTKLGLRTTSLLLTP